MEGSKRSAEEDRSSWRVVPAVPGDAAVMARFWVRLMDEEAPPLFRAGTEGLSRAEKAFDRMLAQRATYRGFLLYPVSTLPAGGREARGEGAVREPGGFILGSVYERLYGEPSRAGNIMHWYVLPELRGRGEGERLYHALMDWFRAEEVESVEVMARAEPSRTAAWSRQGFSVVLDLLVMRAPWSSD